MAMRRSRTFVALETFLFLVASSNDDGLHEHSLGKIRAMQMRRESQSGRMVAEVSTDGTVLAEEAHEVSAVRAAVTSAGRASVISGDGSVILQDAHAFERNRKHAKTTSRSGQVLVNPNGTSESSEGDSEADDNSSLAAWNAARAHEDDIWVPVEPESNNESLLEKSGSEAALDRSLQQKEGFDCKKDKGCEDYDCDGDGKQDCGRWIAKDAMCKGAPKCGYEMKFGDLLLDHSCRCMKCFDQPGTAAHDVPMDPDMKKLVYAHWRGWNKLMETCAPWLMPKNDEDIRTILSFAKQKGYTVRPSGATHSAGALVTGYENRNVLVISLAEYEAPGEWEYSFVEAGGQATVKVNAGWTPLQLYSKIRPRDYFLPTQTAGPVFQLGGLVSNCVHGGNYQKGFLHQYVKKMRVMLHNGTIREISDEHELRFWRNSYGLLGIVTSMEISLEHRPKFQAYTVKRKVPWTEEGFWSFLKQDAHADLAQDVIPAGDAGDRKALMGQFFFNPYEADKGEATMTGIVWRANENATEPGVADSAPSIANTAYSIEMGLKVFDEVLSEQRPSWNGRAQVHTYSDYNVALRHWGGPKVFPLGLSTNDGFAKFPQTMTSMAMNGPSMLIGTNRLGMNDGFFAYKVPNVVYAAYFLDPKHVWEAFNVLVANFNARKDDPLFEWNGPPELRFITITDDAVLNPAPPGVWAVSEFMSFPIGKSDQGWKSAFKSIEDEWMEKFGAKPHIGKFFAFGRTDDGTVEPYMQERVCKIYTEEQKATFNEYRKKADPDDIFHGEFAAKLLQSC